MRIFKEDFEKLHFTESVLGRISVSGETMRVPVRGVFPLRGHPLLSAGDGPYAGYLVFSGVSHSSRTVTEYIGDPLARQGFRDPYPVEDDFSGSQSRGVQREYAFEGLQDEPKAWVDNWVVRAAAFELQIEE